MKVVVLTNGASHGMRILEALQRRRIRTTAVILEREAAPQWPRLRSAIRDLGWQTTAELLLRIVGDRFLPHLPARAYRIFSKQTFRVTDFNSHETARLLRTLGPDLMVLGGARILKPDILECAKVAVLNAHPGLLPAYRGNDVIAWAVHNGDPLGVTVHVVDKGIDTGPLLLIRELPIESGDSISTLRLKAERLAADMMAQAVDEILRAQRVEARMPEGQRGPLYRTMPAELRSEVERKLAER